MIKSMTAFAQRQARIGNKEISCEIKSLNHRYLEINCKLPVSLQSEEMSIRKLMQSKLTRGKVDITILVSDEDLFIGELNTELLNNLLTISNTIIDKWQKPVQLSITDLLSWPGMFSTAKIKTNEITAVNDLVTNTLQDLVEVRQTEGYEIKKLFLEKIDYIENLLLELKKYQNELQKIQTTRIKKKLEEFAYEVNQERFEQELVFYLQRFDIAEELDRLSIHITRFRNYIINFSDNGLGKKLDFMLQELNREANTIAAKAQATKATQLAIDLKITIEQIREQVQNVE